MLASDSLMGGLALYLTYTVFKLLIVLKSRISIYKPGSDSWWHWIEHVLITTMCFIGLGGLTIMKIFHTVDQTIDSNFNYYEFHDWMLVNGFATIIMIAIILLVNHTSDEEKTYNYAPPSELVDGTERRNTYHKHIVERRKIKTND